MKNALIVLLRILTFGASILILIYSIFIYEIKKNNDFSIYEQLSKSWSFKPYDSLLPSLTECNSVTDNFLFGNSWAGTYEGCLCGTKLERGNCKTEDLQKQC